MFSRQVIDELFPLISSFMFQLCKSFAVQCDFEIICEILFFQISTLILCTCNGGNHSDSGQERLVIYMNEMMNTK